MTSTATNPSHFRLSAKTLLLTFPHCPMDKEAALTQLMSTLDQWTPKVAILAQETHEDGSPHLHLAVQLEKKANIRNPRLLDLKGSDGVVYHGDYKSRRNWKTTVVYVTKEDSEPATFGIPDLPAYLLALKHKQSTDIARVASGIMDGSLRDTADIFARHPSLLLSHKRQVEEAVAWVKERKRLRPTATWIPWDLSELSGPLFEVAAWCNLNLGVENRPFKMKQLWIVAKPDTGKSTFCNWLAERFFTYMMPTDDGWDDLYSDDYGLVVVDEFKGQRRVSWLNGFVQGGRFPVKRRGTAPFVKSKNLPVIVLSNYSPQDAYPNCPHVAWESIMARFEVVAFPSISMEGEPPKLFNLIDC